MGTRLDWRSQHRRHDPAPALLPRPVAALLRSDRARPDHRRGRRAVPAHRRGRHVRGWTRGWTRRRRRRRTSTARRGPTRCGRPARSQDDVPLAMAIEDEDREAIQERLELLSRRIGAQRIDLVVDGFGRFQTGSPLGDRGHRGAAAAGERPAGRDDHGVGDRGPGLRERDGAAGGDADPCGPREHRAGVDLEGGGRRRVPDRSPARTSRSRSRTTGRRSSRPRSRTARRSSSGSSRRSRARRDAGRTS